MEILRRKIRDMANKRGAEGWVVGLVFVSRFRQKQEYCWPLAYKRYPGPDPQPLV